MSSPEAHRNNPHSPLDKPYEGSARAWSNEDPDRVKSLEIQPMDPREEASYNNPDTESSPEIESARNTLEQVQQLWDETDEATRRAIWIAMEDNAAAAADTANAKSARKHLRNDAKSGKMDKLEKEVKDLEDAIKAERQKNKAKTGKADSRKSGLLGDKQARKLAKLRKLDKEDGHITRTVENRSLNRWTEDENRNTAAYQEFRLALQDIDKQAEARKNLRSQLEFLPDEDPRRAEIQSIVDSWGDVPDEIVFAQERQMVAAKYEENLAIEMQEKQESEWSDAFAQPDSETGMTVQDIVEKHVKDQESIDPKDKNGNDKDPASMPSAAQQDIIRANLIENGSLEQHLKKYLLEKGIANPENIDQAADYYKKWHDKKNYDKDIANVENAVIDRRVTIEEYLENQKVAKRIARGEITDQADIDNQKQRQAELVAELEQWPEWAEFIKDTTINKNDPQSYEDHLVTPFKTNQMAKAEQAQTIRLAELGF